MNFIVKIVNLTIIFFAKCYREFKFTLFICWILGIMKCHLGIGWCLFVIVRIILGHRPFKVFIQDFL